MALNIMIVDDSPLMRSFIRKVVRLTGIEIGAVSEAGNGEEALSMLHDHWIDLVLTDINMPVMNGEELVRRIEDDESLRDVPVIVVSTDSTRTRIDRMLALGAKGYISKPFQPQNLRDEIEKVLVANHA